MLRFYVSVAFVTATVAITDPWKCHFRRYNLPTILCSSLEHLVISVTDDKKLYPPPCVFPPPPSSAQRVGVY